MPNPWVIGELIQGQYLNSVQELVSDWSDNVLLRASGADVIVPAATHAPAELLIQGQMRYANSDEHVTLSGPAGVYNIYATTKRGRVDFELAASTADVTAQYRRRLGVVEFDGTNVVDVTSDVREINVSHIDGHEPRQSSTPNAIPAGRADATLDPEWLPNLQDARIPVGGIREVWVPNPGLFAIPPQWELCLGQTLQPGQHNWPGFAAGQAITIPDMIDRSVLQVGAGDTLGPGGSNAPVGFVHGHGRAGHGHAVQNHGHDLAVHNHNYGPHYHRVADKRRLNIVTDNPDRQAGHAQRDLGIGPPSTLGNAQPLTAVGAPLQGDNMNAGAGTNAIQGGGVHPGGVPSISLIPLNIGFVYVMRVRD